MAYFKGHTGSRYISPIPGTGSRYFSPIPGTSKRQTPPPTKTPPPPTKTPPPPTKSRSGGKTYISESSTSKRQTPPPTPISINWNKVSIAQIKNAGYKTLSEYKQAYALGKAPNPNTIPKTPPPPPTKTPPPPPTTSQKISQQLKQQTNLTTQTIPLDKKFEIKLNTNEDIGIPTEFSIYQTETKGIQRALSTPE